MAGEGSASMGKAPPWERALSIQTLCPWKENIRSLILVGPTCLGKTAWARSPGCHMHFSGNFDLSLWDNNLELAVFDDFPDCSCLDYKQLFGG
ncbi:hypothetical protein JVT61DRAFT_7252 [Boletus reticuloceps]|uniref:Uncharacterized protein n=1 Tax=Boletus reticuloceps TaxID=495285 RepID=A0A8I2YJP1_9AGAM|nr:hypothetical protein JVT61DRAFT_7252 [Boletus reticuloceps]